MIKFIKEYGIYILFAAGFIFCFYGLSKGCKRQYIENETYGN